LISGVPGNPVLASPSTVTVLPIEIEDVLYNPGMGFADFHFGSGNPPPPDEYPPQTVAYFRWTWDELEPSEGRYNFGQDGKTAHVELGIAGKRPDKWYPVSKVTISN
jgi:hypothetical protein